MEGEVKGKEAFIMLKVLEIIKIAGKLIFTVISIIFRKRESGGKIVISKNRNSSIKNTSLRGKVNISKNTDIVMDGSDMDGR